MGWTNEHFSYLNQDSMPIGLEPKTFAVELRNFIYYVSSTYFQLARKAKTKLNLCKSGKYLESRKK